MYSKKIAILAGLLVILLTSCASALQGQNGKKIHEDGALYIKMKDNYMTAVKSGESRIMSTSRFAFLEAKQKTYGIQSKVASMAFANNPILGRTISITIDSISKIDALIEELEQNPAIEYVEKRSIHYLCAEEEHKYNDPLYGEVAKVNHGWPLDLIKAEDAWKLAVAKPFVKVAVVDNAVWGEHEDLQIAPENLYNVLYQESGVGSASPPSTFPQDPNCTNIITDCPSYLWSHGTHCAGNVGAINNNSKGMASIGGGVTLMGISCPSSTVGAVSNAFEGLRYAAENGAKIVSLSWGGYGMPSKTEMEIVKTCYENGVIMLAAAGNNKTSNPFYPAALPQVISVGSVNSDGKFSETFSNYGPWVDISAPGGFLIGITGTASSYSVLSTTYATNQNFRINGYSALDGQYYDGFFGTSMATPIAAGLCGLLYSVDSTLSPSAMRELLISTNQGTFGESGKVKAGSGVVDAAAAVKALQNQVPRPYDFEYTLGAQEVNFSWKAPKIEGSGLSLANYKIYKNGKLLKDKHTELSFKDTALSAGNYNYTVEAVYTNGKVSLKDGIDFIMDTYYAVNINVDPSENAGTVTGVGKYLDGDTVTVIATPSEGYRFSRWKEDDENLGSDSIYKFKIRYDIDLTAVFRENVSSEDSYNRDELALYPNPTKDRIHIQNLPQGIYEVRIFDLQSKCKQSATCTGGSEISIGVSNLSRGFYIIIAKEIGGEKVLTAKFNKL